MDYEENQVQKIEFASPYWGARRCHFVNTKRTTCAVLPVQKETLKLYLRNGVSVQKKIITDGRALKHGFSEKHALLLEEGRAGDGEILVLRTPF